MANKVMTESILNCMLNDCSKLVNEIKKNNYPIARLHELSNIEIDIQNLKADLLEGEGVEYDS